MISVAIAAYNGERFIKAQLESILNQTVRVDQVVICDDCSTDRTAEICREFIEKNGLSGWEFSVNEQNRGYCHNFYGAIGRCDGDVIFLADQDDVWHSDKVEKMLECLEKNPDVTVLSARYNVIDENGELLENSGVTYLGDTFDGSLETVSAEGQIGCSHIRGFSICFKKSVKPLIKPIDLQSLLSHDWLISMIGSVTGRTAILNTKLTDYRYHKDNVSLSAMDKAHRKRSLEKRIRGIEESLEGHRYIMSLSEDKTLSEHIRKFISFEERRLGFLRSKNLFKWLLLGLSLKEYDRYYKGGGLRVYLGDLAYVKKYT